jgi:hypothetical protein
MRYILLKVWFANGNISGQFTKVPAFEGLSSQEQMHDISIKSFRISLQRPADDDDDEGDGDDDEE